MSCGCNHNHDKNGCNCEEEASVFIDPNKVGEISLSEDGVVTLTMLDDNGNVEQELAMEFDSYEEAEKWLQETFGDLLQEIEEE
ncbi:MAG: hypothetical protein PWQ25_537 [Deferribacteres bacterium]|jgi:hypothetical protein|nr:hypothetical protein [Deferribacteraceae bacterium]MDK2791674.1 hypothetical protein [Deferribacteres bacterium]